MPHYVRELEPARVVSIIQPELQPDRPWEIAESAHLRIGVHDISEHREHHILPGADEIAALIDFIDAWDPGDGALLAHCYAGISRSTATALISATMKTSDPAWAAMRLRAAAPHAAPNSRIIALADDLLGMNGRLNEACAGMGEAVRVVEGPLTLLRIDDEQFR